MALSSSNDPDIFIIKDLGKRLVTFRSVEGYTQKEFAAKIGTSEKRIRGIEKRSYVPDFETLKKIFDILGFENYEIHLALVDKKNKILGSKVKAKKRF